MELNSRGLSGKVALITGANRGIGKAILENFASAGAIVYACARSEGSIDVISEELSVLHNTKIHPYYLDVNDGVAVKNLFSRIYKEEKRIDCLVNNAGIMEDSLIGMITRANLMRTFETNVFAVIDFIQYASRLMKKVGGGSIINISSTVGVNGNAGQLAYSASKGAVDAITKSAAKELASLNIRVNSIAPGVIDTGLLSNLSIAELEQIKSKIRIGRLGIPQDVANLALFFASDLSAYLTGQIVVIDGSWEM